MNAQPGVNLLIEAYLHWAGYNVAIAGANISRAYSPDAALLGAILRLHMGSRAGASLIERDHLALKLFTSLADEKGVLALIEPRPLHLQLWGANPTEADNAYWTEYLSSGLLIGADAVEVPDGQVLEIMARARISPLAIAAIRTINKAAAGFDIQARASEAVGRRWTGKIVGFPEEGKQVHVGTVSSVIKGARFIPTDPIADLKEDSSAAAGVASKVAFENCYAYVLKLDAKDKNYASLDNIENCLVFDDIEELRSTLIEATPAQLAKPVIILHPGLHDDETYIPRSVARHWSYGGRYILAPAHFSYVVETGDIKIELVENDMICRFTLTGAVTSLPASQICDLNPHSQLLFPKDGICIAYADANLTIADVAKLEREYRPKSISSSDFERLTLRSSVDGAYLDTIDLNVHWPLSKIVLNFRIAHRDLKDLIRIARRNPTEVNVNALFAALTRKGVDIAYILSDLFGFIRETSSASTLTLSMKPEHLVTYISYARRSPDADEIAINMSTYADKICLRDVNLIFPLFELLASCLDQAQLSAVLAFCASRCVRSSDRYTFRVAEGLRRYGDSTALALLLVDLYNADQVELQKRELLRSFEPLLRSDLRASIERQLGSALIERIEATVEVSDRIDRRVRTRDRQGAMELLGSSLSIARLDFFKLLDHLRALSNELREIAIPISAIACDGLDHQPKQLLAAAVFSDTEVIRYLCELGLVDQINDINAVARNIAGDNAMLNGIVATAFDGHDVAAYEIEGDSVPDVFAAASRVNVSGVGDSSKKVTVIMSAFNPDIPLMEQAVASVMNQSHRNVELIIIDDASAPELAAEISTIAGRFDNCSLIRLETNAGPYIGRNLAIEQATGDYIAIHDADDWAHPDRLRAQLAMFEEDPHARLLTAYHIRIDRAGKVQFEADFSIFGDGPMTSMFKRDVFNEVGPFAYVRSRGDVEMRERIRSYYGHHAIVTLPLPLLLCFADTSTLSQQTKANNLEYLQLFRTNISRRSPLGTFRRKEEALSAANQILVPKRLRAAMPVKEQVL
ncbi:hypothetical protein sphantq_01992 [Sphingobium sp. AntQ-1]|nr:hypothetical protein sphantq_01992 [Sphingobium sp. AntQ-1]